MSVTRLQLFEDVAAELGDAITLTASAAGTVTSFVASEDMFWADAGLDGRECWYASAQVASLANKGKRRLVTDTDEDAASITVRPAWPAIPQIGDVLILVNSRGTGVTIPEIHAKINQLIRRVADEMAREVAGTPSTFDWDTPSLSIPTTWDYIQGMQYEPSSEHVNDWENALADATFYQPWDRTVTVRPRYRDLFQSKRVRLIGAISLDPLAADADTTTVPASWLAKTAAYELLEAAALRTGDVATAFTYGELLKTDAALQRPRVGKRFQSVGKRLYIGRSS